MNYCQFRNQIIKRMCSSPKEIPVYTFDITVPQGNSQVRVFCRQTVANAAIIDWGDNTAATSTGSSTNIEAVNHTYETAGDYTLTITANVSESEFWLQGASNWASGYIYIPNNGTVLSAVIPDGVKEIRYYAFYGRALTQVTLPDTIQSIGQRGFYGTKLSSIELPKDLITIGQAAFYYITTLTDVVFGENLQTIGDSAFAYSSPLTTLTFKGTTPPTISSSAFIKNINPTIYIPSGTLAAYQAAFTGTVLANKTIIEV